MKQMAIGKQLPDLQKTACERLDYAVCQQPDQTTPFLLAASNPLAAPRPVLLRLVDLPKYNEWQWLQGIDNKSIRMLRPNRRC